MKAGGPEFKSLVPILKLARLQVPITPVLGVGNKHMPGACWLVNLTKQGASHRGRHFTASPDLFTHIHIHIQHNIMCAYMCTHTDWAVSAGVRLGRNSWCQFHLDLRCFGGGEGLLYTAPPGFLDQDSGDLEPRPGIWRDEPCFPRPCFLTPTLCGRCGWRPHQGWDIVLRQCPASTVTPTTTEEEN